MLGEIGVVKADEIDRDAAMDWLLAHGIRTATGRRISTQVRVVPAKTALRQDQHDDQKGQAKGGIAPQSPMHSALTHVVPPGDGVPACGFCSVATQSTKDTSDAEASE